MATVLMTIEYYRQFSFVSSVLAGFALTLFGTLLLTPSSHRAGSWAALLSVAASISFLVVTLGMTFAATVVAGLSHGQALPHAIVAELGPLSTLFIVGILLLLSSFGLGGWIRSRSLGIATTIAALAGLACILWVMMPFMMAD